MGVRKLDDNKEKAKLYQKVSIKQIRSTISRERSQLQTLQCLGLGRIGRVVEQYAEPSIVGMLRKVAHLVEVREAK